MKDYERVKVIKDRTEYEQEGIHKGDKGTVMIGEERNGYILVLFEGKILQDKDGVFYSTDIDIGMRVEDLEVIDE